MSNDCIMMFIRIIAKRPFSSKGCFEYYVPFTFMDGCEVFNVGRATHWDFADGLGVNQKADPETIGLAILILGQVARPSLCQGTPRGIIDRKLGGRCTHDEFYMHQAPLAYMVVFGQR